MPRSTLSTFWGILLAAAVIAVIFGVISAMNRQNQEQKGIDDICGRMNATTGQSMADCRKQLKSMGY